MRKFILIAFFSLALSLSLLSCGLHSLLSDDLSDSKITEALQEALSLGSQTAANNLGTPCADSSGGCTTGYLGNKQEIDLLGNILEIALPDTVENVLNTVDFFLGEFDALPSPITSAINLAMNSNSSNSLSSLRGLGDKIKRTLNEGAEQAAPESKVLFKDAIFQMSFSDARSILFGSDDRAATSYLKDKTFDGLQGIFGGILAGHLNRLNLNDFWSPIASNYNSFAHTYKSAITQSSVTLALTAYNLGKPASSQAKLPGLPYNDDLPDDISAELSHYATGKALDGLFYMVGVQESKLRADPWGAVAAVGNLISGAVGDLLGDVFSRANKAKEG